jgi:hypothetical protein
MRVRLYWLAGRVEELKGEVDAATTTIVRQTADGHHHFTFAEEIDDEGFAIFWEDEEAISGPASGGGDR